MKYYIYKTTNLTNGKIYIGYHASDNIESDKYLGSGKLLKRAVDKYSPENFKREILFEFNTQDEALEKEREIVNDEFIADKNTYNVCLGGSGGGLPGELNPFFGRTHTQETKDKLSKANKGKKLTDEHKQKISKGLLESVPFQTAMKSEERSIKLSESLRNSEAHKEAMKSPERSARISEGIKNSVKFHETMASEEYRKAQSERIKNSEAHNAAMKSPERRKKVSDALKGKPHPWQDKVNKNPEKIEKTAAKHRGMKRSEQTCKNVSESLKGKYKGTESNSFKGYWVTPWGKFDSLGNAASELGNGFITIRDRCLEKNNNVVRQQSLTADSKLDKSMIGKTWAELGWGFEPAENKNVRRQ